MQTKDKQVLTKKVEEFCGNTSGMIIYKDNIMEYEQYFHDFTNDDRIHVFSITKSIINIVFGIAMDKGYISSVQQPILDFFPNYVVKKREHTIQHITIEDMLTMCAPYKYKFAPYTKYFKSDDWLQSSLDLIGGKGHIGEFQYAPIIGPDIVSGIIAKSTQRTLIDFANENLFEPLHIAPLIPIHFKDKEEQMQFYKREVNDGWVCDPKGNACAGWGLCLSLRDMLALGTLYLQDGMFEGKQIVSKNWVQTSTQEHSRWEKFDIGYGYLWWIHEFGFAAMGDGGNIIYVNRKKHMVVVMGATLKRRIKDRLDFIQEYVEPLFE